jgi:biopolymer transport protein ExbD
MMSTLVYTPGVRVNLPVGDNLPGTDRRTIAVAIAKGGQMYYRSQLVEAKELRFKLAEEAKRFAEPPTLMVMMDKDVTGQMLMNLSLLARDAGITELSWAAIPSDRLVPSSRIGP